MTYYAFFTRCILAYWQQQTISCTEYQKISSSPLHIAFIGHFYCHIDHSGNTCRHHQWKQAETMVALATLALQSAKQLFQKGFGNQHMTCLFCLELTFSHRGWYWSLFQIKILQKSSILMTLVCEAVHYKNDWHNHIGIYNFFFCLPIFFWYTYIENYI